MCAASYCLVGQASGLSIRPKLGQARPGIPHAIILVISNAIPSIPSMGRLPGHRPHPRLRRRGQMDAPAASAVPAAVAETAGTATSRLAPLGPRARHRTAGRHHQHGRLLGRLRHRHRPVPHQPPLPLRHRAGTQPSRPRPDHRRLHRPQPRRGTSRQDHAHHRAAPVHRRDQRGGSQRTGGRPRPGAHQGDRDQTEGPRGRLREDCGHALQRRRRSMAACNTC